MKHSEGAGPGVFLRRLEKGNYTTLLEGEWTGKGQKQGK